MAVQLADFEAGTPFSGDYGDRLERLQEKAARLLVAAHIYGRKAVILFEGWDASGKGGAIQRLVARCDPRHFEVHPISAPTAEEKAGHYLQRFWARLPKAGEAAIFDRSWYGRVLVERVEGYASRAEWMRAYDEINEFEAQLAADGTILVKIFLHVTAETQDERLRKRLAHEWKRWKIGPEDFRNRARRSDYLAALTDMFAATDTAWAPWTVIDGNDKKAARIAVLDHVTRRLEAALPAEPPPLRPEVEQLAQTLGKGSA